VLLIGVAVLTVMLSWTVVNTIYTLRYADLHFGSTAAGIAFADSAGQEVIRRQLAALPVVQRFAYESQAEAFQRYRAMFRNQPQKLAGVTQQTLPASFRVVLDDPRQFSQLFRAFCPQLGPDGKPACVKGVEVVVDQHQVTWDGLAGPGCTPPTRRCF
jgi:cell division protein FtsX